MYSIDFDYQIQQNNCVMNCVSKDIKSIKTMIKYETNIKEIE